MIIFFTMILLIISAIFKPKINFDNAITILFGTWGIALLTCFSNVFTSYNDLNISTVIFVLLTLIMITVSYFIGSRSLISDKHYHYDFSKVIKAFNLLTIVVVISFILTIVLLGLPATLGGEIARSAYYLPNGGEVFYLMIFPTYFLGLIYCKYNGNWHNVLFQLFILSAIIILKGNKMGLFSIVLMYLYLFGRKFNLFKVICLILGIIFAFYMASFIYTQKVLNIDALKIAKMNLSGFSLGDKLYFLYDPLIYLATNLNNLNSLVTSNLGGIGLGTISFTGISQILALPFPEIEVFSNFASSSMARVIQIPDYNTFSAIGLLYTDFGMFITVSVMSIISFFSGREHKRFKNGTSSLSLSFFGFILFQTIALSFFTFYFGNLEVITNILMMFVISIYVRKYEK